jgi:signal transduction histidine kinase
LSYSYFKSVLICLAVASVTSLFSLASWLVGIFGPIEGAFLMASRSAAHIHTSVGLNVTAATVVIVSAVVGFVMIKFGVRRALPYLVGGFAGFAALSFAASWYASLNLHFVPVAVSASLAALAIQIVRLHAKDFVLMQKLNASTLQLGTVKADDAQQRLHSSLKLLETVLSPTEAIVFRRDIDDQLVASARLRSQITSTDTSRNSTWRDGVKLCERAIKLSEAVVEETSNDDRSVNIAWPLRHEDRTVGALLLRINQEFNDDDRALLSAVGGQMARNLQREEAHKESQEYHPLAFFSVTASTQKVQSLYVLNGALVEQRVGINALSEIDDGVALAYLDGRIAYINQALLALATLSRDQTSNIGFFELLDRFRTDIFDEPAIAVRRVLQTAQPYEGELHFADKGVTYGLRISLVYDDAKPTPKGIRRSAEPLCLALVIRDLTRVKEYEQLKSDMISLMSHELRTPLTSINGFAELLTTDETLPEQAKEFVTIIANESQRLSRMINTFLAVTKLQRKDRQEVLKIPLRLDEVVKETITNLQPVAKKRRIRLIEQPSQKLPPVAADKSMITQAVKNLVSNAIKYSPERTTVTVSTALEAEAVRLTVEDRGYGIPAEAKDRVWEKFYRVVREGEDKDEESTGLGLSFVREVVEQHGGSVDLESEVGRGSKFSFTLPRL